MSHSILAKYIKSLLFPLISVTWLKLFYILVSLLFDLWFSYWSVFLLDFWLTFSPPTPPWIMCLYYIFMQLAISICLISPIHSVFQKYTEISRPLVIIPLSLLFILFCTFCVFSHQVGSWRSGRWMCVCMLSFLSLTWAYPLSFKGPVVYFSVKSIKGILLYQIFETSVI